MLSAEVTCVQIHNAQCTLHMHIYSLCPKQVSNIALQDIEPRSEESADEVSESYGQQESDVMFCFDFDQCLSMSVLPFPPWLP